MCTYYNGKWSTDYRKQGKNRVFHTGWVLILPKYSMYPYVNNCTCSFLNLTGPACLAPSLTAVPSYLWPLTTRIRWQQLTQTRPNHSVLWFTPRCWWWKWTVQSPPFTIYSYYSFFSSISFHLWSQATCEWQKRLKR